MKNFKNDEFFIKKGTIAKFIGSYLNYSPVGDEFDIYIRGSDIILFLQDYDLCKRINYVKQLNEYKSISIFDSKVEYVKIFINGKMKKISTAALYYEYRDKNCSNYVLNYLLL